jgi:hypothetical protein
MMGRFQQVHPIYLLGIAVIGPEIARGSPAEVPSKANGVDLLLRRLGLPID